MEKKREERENGTGFSIVGAEKDISRRSKRVSAANIEAIRPKHTAETRSL